MGDGAGIWDGVYWGVARVRMYERRRREGTGAGRFFGGVRHNEKKRRTSGKMYGALCVALNAIPTAYVLALAESEGFEPPVQLPVHRISSAARSTTPATFLVD